jgi:hypothetical protein
MAGSGLLAALVLGAVAIDGPPADEPRPVHVAAPEPSRVAAAQRPPGNVAVAFTSCASRYASTTATTIPVPPCAP